MSRPEKEIKSEPTNWRQLILLDDLAFIIASCDSIFSTGELRSAPVTDQFPLLESIYDRIVNLTPDDPEIRVSKVETTYKGLPGYYDFTFVRTEIDSRKPILWTIYDYTRLYNDYYEHQQRKYELELAKELLRNSGN